MYCLKAFVVAVTLVSVTTNPVVASMKLCCCVPQSIQAQAFQVRGCCRTENVQTSATIVAQNACCAKKRASSGVNLPFPGRCCCIKSQDTTSSSQRLAAPHFDECSIRFPNWDGVPTVPQSIISSNQGHPPRRFSPSGPPLLALHCTWRK